MKTEYGSWILLRGLAREHRHWGTFPECLRTSLPGVNILQPDLPGCGLHYRQECPPRMRKILDLVRAEVLAQQPGAPVYILGLSLGGMLALEWVNRYPGECAGAVLMNISLAGINPFYLRLRPECYWRILTKLVLGRDVQSAEAAIVNLVSNHAPQRARTLEQWVDFAREKPVSGTNVLRQLIAAMRYAGPPARPAVPLLLLSGLGDHLVNPACSTRIARRWGLSLESHPTAGHDLTLDAERWVCDMIRNWMESACRHS